MNETDLQLLLKKRSGTERRVYDAIRQHGKITDRQLRDLLGSPGSGPRDALARLLPLGVVRHAGRAATKNNPMQYEVTPLAEIEEEKERYAARKPRKRTRRGGASPGARLADRRQMELGDPRKWHPVRDKILAALPVLTNTVTMSFWESVPADELQLALDEIEKLYEAAGEALTAGRKRLEHERYKAKIEKMGNRKGRTAAESVVVDRKVEALSRKLIESESRR